MIELENFFDGKNVLVTGANGFFGSWLAKRLVEKKAIVNAFAHSSELNPVLPLQQKNFRIIKGDIRQFDSINTALKLSSPEIVFHLAAIARIEECIKNPFNAMQTNIIGTTNLLEAIRKSSSNHSIVFASTYRVYAQQKNKLKEDSELLGKNLYDFSKILGEQLVNCYSKNYGINSAIGRFSNTYGFAAESPNLVQKTIEKIEKNEKPVVFGDGKAKREFLFIEDALDAYEAIAKISEKKFAETFNFGTEKPIEIIKVVEKIIELNGKKTKIDFAEKDERKEEAKSICLNCEKARKELDWKAKYSLEKGLIETIKQYNRFNQKK